ncbi:flavin reductase family protein [Daejeonella oryzae]|uniref:flavin reductase family protein n=1 Tax=Daejeonella oryzae TaxID=1122943 RepID=UPI00047E967F|nr:flavin reductase [Daejeonella oryzae]
MIQTFSHTDLNNLDNRFRSTLINSISGFKSLQLVGTLSPDDRSNLAVFNSIFHLGANPPLIGMVVRPDGNEHSTLKNIISQKFYTLNNVRESFYKDAHQTSARYAEGDSEFKNCNFTEQYISDFSAPFVGESNIKIGLELKQIIPVELNNTNIIIGEIKLIQFEDGILSDDGFINLNQAGSVTVAGLDSYYTTAPLSRLAYAKPGKEPMIINNQNI